MKKITKKTIKKSEQIRKKFKIGVFTFGDINPSQGRILLLNIAIIFAFTGVIISNYANIKPDAPSTQVNLLFIKKETPFEKQTKNLVAGYPIAEMTPYILEKDPRVAAFMIAIAKKESAWGKRKPVLNGRDCYNYWGFRLKSEKMGSGGHTCFDTPQQAVDAVASRIDELVNEENITSPKAMIVWKCGYGCQDKSKTADERKWISDVDVYYSKLENYL